MFQLETLAEKHVEGLHRAIDLVAQERRFLGITSAPAWDPFMREAQEAIRMNRIQLVATRNEEVLGWCSICQIDLPTLQHAGTLFMGIIQPWRGRGIGKSLLAATLDKAWDRRLSRIDLEVYTHNAAAIRLYRRFGFIKEGFKRHAHCLDGRYHDILLMAHVRQKKELPLAATSMSGVASPAGYTGLHSHVASGV